MAAWPLGANHVDVQLEAFRIVARLSAKVFRFEDAQRRQDGAKGGLLSEFAGDGQGAVEWDAAVEEGRNLLREEQDAAAPARAEGRQLQLKAFLFLKADVDGGEALAAEFGGDTFVGFAGQSTGADLAVGGYGTK
jgi:hypothetical protein